MRTLPNELVEQSARAMFRASPVVTADWDDVCRDNPDMAEEVRLLTRHAIAAFLAAARSEGWVMCHPEEKISEGVLKAGNEAALSFEVLVGNRRFSCERATYTAVLRAKLAEEG